MEKTTLDEFVKETSEYNLLSDLRDEILERLKNSIISNDNIIMNANKEDVIVNKKQIKIKKLLDIIDEYKNFEHSENAYTKNIIIYKGDPYLTLHLCLQALLERKKVALLYEDFMIGVNEVLISIFNRIINGFGISNLIDYISNYSMEDIEEIREFYDNFIIIGDTTAYQIIKEKNENVKFFPYNNIILYCDTNELLKLQEAICIYANENQFEIEIIGANSIEKAIEIINLDNLKNVAILLTQNEEYKNMFQNSVQNKDVYVNDNPFKQEVGKVYNYL